VDLCIAVSQFSQPFHSIKEAMPKKSTKRAVKRTAKRAVKKVAKKVAKKSVRKVAKKSAAGRPKGSGTYGCETKSVRVPIHLVDAIKAFALKKIKAGQ